MPLSPGNSSEEGERANGKDLGKEKGSKEKDPKRRAYGVGRTLLSMLGQEDSAERVPAIGHDLL